QVDCTQAVLVVSVIHVGDFKRIDVFDQPIGQFTIQGISIADQVSTKRHAVGHGPQGSADDGQQKNSVNQYTRAQDTRPPAVQRVFGGITDQATRVFHFVHDLVADVHAGGAGDTFDLQSFTDIDTSGANLHTQRAADAVSQSKRLDVSTFL